MSNVTFVKYATQANFETARNSSGLSDGVLYFVEDTHKIYRGTGANTAVDFTEPFALVNNSTAPLPELENARVGCLYINTDTYEIKLRPRSTSRSYVVVVPALNTALADLQTAITKLTTVYNYKGSKATYASLPASDNVIGDVWNVEAAYNDYPAGTNFAWNGTGWDALGGSVDLSGYISDSRVSSPSSGDVLVYQEADTDNNIPAGWYNIPLTFNNLEDYTSDGNQSTGEAIVFDSSLGNSGKWTRSGYTLPLNSNTVELGTGNLAPSDGQVLTFNGTSGKWTNKTFTATIAWTEINGN